MFTTCVNGSYPKIPEPPRPPLLQIAMNDYADGRITDRELARAKERVTVEAVAEMVAAGVEVVSDGKIRWDDDLSYICSRLDGFEIVKSQESREPGCEVRPRVTDRIRWVRPIVEGDYRFISERSPVEVRPVLTGPFSLAGLCDPGVYTDRINDLTCDLARALNRELQGLEAAGARYILIEETLLTSHKSRSDTFLEAAALLCEGISATVMLGTSTGDLVGFEAALEEAPFGGISFDLIEGPENERIMTSANFLEGRIIQLGLVHSADPRLEGPMEVAQGIMKYARYHDPDLIWVAPTGGLGALPRDRAFEKLTNMYQAVQWTRREMARQEEPGGTI